MKKSILTLILIVSVCFYAISPPLSARASDITYAQMPENATLYTLNGQEYTPCVILPATYFVTLLEPDDGKSEYLSVSYLDITGFILRSSVTICDYEPVTKYASLSAHPSNDGLGLNLRSSPDHQKGKILATVPNGSSLTYYGSIAGSSLIPAVGNTWYYCKYTSGSVSTFGYVYSAHAVADTMEENVVIKVPEKQPDKTPDTTIENTPILDTKLQVILIITLCIPAIAIMFLIFKKSSKKKQAKPRHSQDD